MFFLALDKDYVAGLSEKGMNIKTALWQKSTNTHGYNLEKRPTGYLNKVQLGTVLDNFLPNQKPAFGFWKASNPSSYEQLKFTMSWPKLNKYITGGTGGIHRDSRPWSNWNACM
jgi:hypothetical protein